MLRSKYKHREGYRYTLKDLYSCYSFKKRPHNRYPTFPYVPKQEDTDTEYSLTYKEWKTLVDKYFEFILDKVLFKGMDYVLPHNLGTLSIQKYKGEANRIDFFKTLQTGVYHYHDNTHTDNWCPMLVWDKPLRYRHVYSSMWRIKLTKNASTKLSNLAMSDVSTFNTLNEVKK